MPRERYVGIARDCELQIFFCPRAIIHPAARPVKIVVADENGKIGVSVERQRNSVEFQVFPDQLAEKVPLQKNSSGKREEDYGVKL